MTTYRYTDSVGDTLDVQPVLLASGPAVSVAVNEAAAWVPVDQTEEFIAGIRESARVACESAAAVPAGQAPATDRAALREAIRRAVCEAEGFAWDSDMLEPDEYGDHADAVLAALPASVDRADVLREEAARIRAHCPDHLDADSAEGAWMDCHCPVADDMRKRANELRTAAKSDRDHVVAYRSPAGTALYCTRHYDELGPLWPPVLSEDLPDGGLCTKCGADVLIPQQPKKVRP